MIRIEKRFDSGYARPVHRGVSLGLDAERRRVTSVDQLVYDALANEYDLAHGTELHCITARIEIETVGIP